jgi:hypothetical protein
VVQIMVVQIMTTSHLNYLKYKSPTVPNINGVLSRHSFYKNLVFVYNNHRLVMVGGSYHQYPHYLLYPVFEEQLHFCKVYL